ncbi:MAG: TniB family NTP-binding protein [Sulfurovum sp.]|nr:TniB family NTP-binding protein [Sulfurovum sp.]
MNKYPHLSDIAAEMAGYDSQKRLAFLNEPIWISYTRAEKLISLMQDYMQMPKRARMKNLLVIGDSNMGKTTILERFMRQNPPVEYQDEHNMYRTRIPVVMIQAPTIADEKNLYASILNQFWTSFRPSDTTIKLRHHMYSQMRECDVQMLIIDEIHNLLDTTTIKQRQIMNAIKTLGNELKIPIVAVGINTAATILSNDPQLASRYSVVKLGAWSLDREFLGLLKGFEKRLPLRKPSMLYGKEKAPFLLKICEGNLGNLHTLLTECTKDAITQGTEEITLEIIKKNQWVRPTQKNAPMEIPL